MTDEPILEDAPSAPHDHDIESPKSDPIEEGPTPMVLTNTAWKLIFGTAAAVIVFLLAQQDVPLDPIVRVVLGAIAVALAVVNPNRDTSEA